METLIQQFESDLFRLTVIPAEGVDNPLNKQDLITVVGRHRNYKVGNRDIGNQNLLEYIAEDLEISLYPEVEEEEFDYDHPKSEDQLLQDISKKAFITPVYMYEHSGIAVYSAPIAGVRSFDQSFIGFAYVSKELVSSRYKEKDLDKLAITIGEFLNDLLKEYSYYLSGDVYDYILESKQYCPHCNTPIFTEIDNYSYFYTLDHSKNGIEDVLLQTIAQSQVSELLSNDVS